MVDEERKYIEKINIDKVKLKTNIAIGISVVNLVCYIIMDEFRISNFGIIFDVFSCICLLISRNKQSKYDLEKSRKWLIFSIVFFGWIFIYDVIATFITVIREEALYIFAYAWFYGGEIMVVYLAALLAVKMDLDKADNPEKYKESTDWFFETYDKGQQDKKRKK